MNTGHGTTYYIPSDLTNQPDRPEAMPAMRAGRLSCQCTRRAPLLTLIITLEILSMTP